MPDLTREIGRKLSKEEAQMLVQEKLATAKQLLGQAENLSREHRFQISFLEMDFDAEFGWMRGGVLISESEWNTSGCVIGMPEPGIYLDEVAEMAADYERLRREELDRNRR